MPDLLVTAGTVESAQTTVTSDAQGRFSMRVHGEIGLVAHGPMFSSAIHTAAPGIVARVVVIRESPVRGRARYRDGRPAVDAVVTTIDRRGRFVAARETTCDADGRFSFGSISHHVHGFRAVSADGKHSTVALFDDDGPDVVLVLDPRHTVEVSVEDPLGRGIGGANVTLVHERHGSSSTSDPLSERVSTSDATGVVRFDRVEPGSFRLSVAAPGFAPFSTDLDQTRTAGHRLVRVAMAPGSAVEGTVRRRDGSPVAGAEVGSFPTSAETTVTDTDGRYRLVGLDPGTIRIHASAEQLERGHSDEVDLAVGQTATDVDLVLPPRRRVAGRVCDELGTPLPDALVNGEPVALDGSFEIELLSRLARMVVTCPGFVSMWLDRSRHAEGAPPIDVRLTRGTEVRGRVLDPNEQPVAGAQVTLRPRHVDKGADRPLPLELYTDLDGRSTPRTLPNTSLRSPPGRAGSATRSWRSTTAPRSERSS